MADIFVYRKQPPLSGGLFQRNLERLEDPPRPAYFLPVYGGRFDEDDSVEFQDFVGRLDGLWQPGWSEADVYYAIARDGTDPLDLIFVVREYRSPVLQAIRSFLQENEEEFTNSRIRYYDRLQMTSELRKVMAAYKDTPRARFPAYAFLKKRRGSVLAERLPLKPS